MKVSALDLDGILVIEPDVFEDDRGSFSETYSKRNFADATGIDPTFVQENQSTSRAGVVRGLHYQLPPSAQGKLLRVVRGEIFDTVVDLRKSSSTFGRWTATTLSSDNQKQIWIPEGFAHGFLALSEIAIAIYLTTDFYSNEHERCIAWNDPDIGIEWPTTVDPTVSAKDSNAPDLSVVAKAGQHLFD